MAPRTRSQTTTTANRRATRREGKNVQLARQPQSARITKTRLGARKAAPKTNSSKNPPPGRASTPAICHLLLLPNELLSTIISFCDQADFAALAHTSRRLYFHASPALYKDITIVNETTLELLSRHHYEQGTRLVNQVQSCQLYLPAQSESDYVKKCTKSIDAVGQMANLKSILIQYDYSLDEIEREELGHWGVMLIPAQLASTLTSCTLLLNPHTAWPVRMAIPLLNHKSLKELILHSATSRSPPADTPYGSLLLPLEDIGKHGHTELVHLKLVDCYINRPDLQRILDCPRALRTLSVCSDSDLKKVLSVSQPSFDYFFDAISESRSGKSLEGLRMDGYYFAVAIVPAPGMHRFTAVRYLETTAHHLFNCHDPNSSYEIPEIDVEAGELLPPDVEVLKVGLDNVDFSYVIDFLTQNKEFLPRLRRIILSVQYRDAAMSRELRRVAAKEMDFRHWAQTWEEKQSKFPVSPLRQNEDEMVSLGKELGIEIMIIHQDSIRKEVFKEGAGPDLWDIPEQIA